MNENNGKANTIGCIYEFQVYVKQKHTKTIRTHLLLHISPPPTIPSPSQSYKHIVLSIYCNHKRIPSALSSTTAPNRTFCHNPFKLITNESIQFVTAQEHRPHLALGTANIKKRLTRKSRHLNVMLTSHPHLYTCGVVETQRRLLTLQPLPLLFSGPIQSYVYIQCGLQMSDTPSDITRLRTVKRDLSDIDIDFERSQS